MFENAWLIVIIFTNFDVTHEIIPVETMLCTIRGLFLYYPKKIWNGTKPLMVKRYYKKNITVWGSTSQMSSFIIVYKSLPWNKNKYRKSIFCSHCQRLLSPRTTPCKASNCHTLLQELLKMKLSSGKVQAWEWKIPLLVPKHFAPCPYWYFTFFHAGNIFRYLGQDHLLDVTGKFRKSLKL